jgi:hypothetical protein
METVKGVRNNEIMETERDRNKGLKNRKDERNEEKRKSKRDIETFHGGEDSSRGFLGCDAV